MIKFAVKLNMTLGESIPVFGNWFQICFVENNGMAFGMQFGGMLGKLALTLFRIVLIGFIVYYLRKLIKKVNESRNWMIKTVVNLFEIFIYG